MDVRYRIALVGYTGYVGQVLHALLMQHDRMDPVVIQARDPSSGGVDECEGADVVVLATPADAARVWTPALRAAGHRVLDCSDAHRQIDGVHYGLPELFGPPPASADLVANPGCYPTASLLALRPLLQGGCIEPTGIAIAGSSGTSGAGKGLRDDLHFSALFGNVFPYKVGEHRHTPEISLHLGAPVAFVPTLLPIVRGMLVTAFVRPTKDPSALLAVLREAYEPHPWVSVLPAPGANLGVLHAVGTHQALIAVGPVEHSGVVPVFCAIDNLLRGAASLALHNLNLWLSLPVDLGMPPPRADLPVSPPPMTRLSP